MRLWSNGNEKKKLSDKMKQKREPQTEEESYR